MKKYTTPELNVTKFDVEDVITTSLVLGTKGDVEEFRVDQVAEALDYNVIFGDNN